MDEMVPAEDIEKMVKAVLSIQLLRPPDEVRSTINNTTGAQDDVKNLEEEVRTLQKLLQQAQQIKEKTKTIDVDAISRDVSAADSAVNKAHDILTAAVRDKGQAQDQVKDVEDKLDHIETKLMNQSEDLLKHYKTLKNKSEQNRAMAREAREAADIALNITDQMDLQDVMTQFEILKQKQPNTTVEDEAADQLKKILKEAKDMQTQVEERLQQMRDLEQKIQQLFDLKEQKAAEVSELLGTVESLQKEIVTRAEGYQTCRS